MKNFSEILKFQYAIKKITAKQRDIILLHFTTKAEKKINDPIQWRTEGMGVWGFKPPPPKFRSFDKTEPNSLFREKYIRNNLIRILVSLICKLNGTPD
jgi:hypothetical protein